MLTACNYHLSKSLQACSKIFGTNKQSAVKWPCMPEKCHKVAKLFRNFEARFFKCYYVTMSTPGLTCFAKLTQQCCNVVMPTSRRSCEFKVAVKLLYWHCLSIYYPSLRERRPMLYLWGCIINVVNLTQRIEVLQTTCRATVHKLSHQNLSFYCFDQLLKPILNKVRWAHIIKTHMIWDFVVQTDYILIFL